MPRGGKRSGAGRKPILSKKQSFIVGQHCEVLKRATCHEINETRLAECLDLVNDEWNIAKAIPQHKRKAWRLEQDALYEKEDAHGNKTPEGYFVDVETALKEQQGIDEESDIKPSRILRIEEQKKCPYGLRKKIIADVASQTGLTERMVEKCWKKYR